VKALDKGGIKIGRVRGSKLERYPGSDFNLDSKLVHRVKGKKGGQSWIHFTTKIGHLRGKGLSLGFEFWM
jgi:hypothetical protein